MLYARDEPYRQRPTQAVSARIEIAIPYEWSQKTNRNRYSDF